MVENVTALVLAVAQRGPAAWISLVLVVVVCVAAARVLRVLLAALVCVAVVGVWLGWWQWEEIWAWYHRIDRMTVR